PCSVRQGAGRRAASTLGRAGGPPLLTWQGAGRRAASTLGRAGGPPLHLGGPEGRPYTYLPLHFHSELKLPGIVSRCWLPGVGKQRADCCHVIAIRDVEHVHDQLKANPLVNRDILGHSQVIEHCPGSMARVPSQVAVQLLQGYGGSRCQERQDEPGDTRFLEYSAWREPGVDNHSASRVRGHIWPSRQRRKLKIVAVAGNDVEGPPRAELNQRGKCPIAE